MIELQYYLSNLPDCFIYGLLAMGIYISLRILDIPDLTTEGSFGFGAVVSVLVSLQGHPMLALAAGIFAGAFAGLITGCLQTKLQVHPVLAGIITMSGLYSINLVCYSLTDKGATTNLSYNKITVFEKVKELIGIRGQFETNMVKAVVSLVVVILVLAIIIWFFKTHIGLCIRATGDNPDMVRASSINVDRTKIIGLMLANALIGLSGALASQSIGYADINTSNGTLIYGLAAVIIGEAIFGKRGATVGVISAVTGSVIYKLIVAFVIRENLFGDKSANLMKFTCALIVAITLAVPAIKQKIAEKKAEKGGEIMLDIQNISKTFEKGTVNEHVAIRDLSIKLNDGEFVTIVGSNGAGKSTLFNAICGSFMVDEGHILLDDEDITYKSEHQRARMIGRVFQDPMKGTAPNMTIEENLALAYTRADQYSTPFSRAITKKKVAFFRENLARYNMGIEDRMRTKIGLLSGGQRQVVTLLMCTLSIPKLLLLDEHTAALDPATAEKVMDITKTIVSENNITTMMITHNLKQSLTTGTRTIMLDSGEIILDVSGKERDHMTMDDMIQMYSMKKQKEFDNDRMLLNS